MNEIYQYNAFITDISNNWEYVKNMVKKYAEGKLKRIDQFEQQWFSFILQNSLKLEEYINEDDFFEKNIKPLGTIDVSTGI